jgi:hypothetical protein
VKLHGIRINNDIKHVKTNNEAFHSLWIKPTYTLNSNFIGITTIHVLDSLSAHHQEFLALHGFSTFYADLMYQCWCTAKNSSWWAERLSKTCIVVIPIKLEFSASVGFIHKESVTMHGHRIVAFHITWHIFKSCVFIHCINLTYLHGYMYWTFSFTFL